MKTLYFLDYQLRELGAIRQKDSMSETAGQGSTGQANYQGTNIPQEQATSMHQLVQQIQQQRTPESKMRRLVEGVCSQGDAAANNGIGSVQEWLSDLRKNLDGFIA